MDPALRPPSAFAADPPATPATPRDSSTVVVVRDRHALEVFMLERHLSSDFVGGAFVFPGGTLDAADSDPAIADHVEGIDADHVRALGDGALGLIVCAIRETFEEAGILFARHLDGTPVRLADEERWEGYRRALNAREITALDLARDARIVFAADLLRFWWRLVTPVFAPKRYDTRFFVAVAPEGQEPLHDDVETTSSVWVRPLDAAARGRAGEFAIIFPTRKTLEQIGSYGSTASVFAAAAGRDAAPICPRFELVDGEPRVILPDGTVDIP